MNKIKQIFYLFSAFLIFVLQSCESIESSKYDKKELTNYFETNDIQIETIVTNKIQVSVNNSGLVLRELQKKGGNKWETAEAYGSIGALIMCSQVKDQLIDSIVMKIKKGDNAENYSYSINDLKNVRKYVDTCLKFTKLISSSDLDNAKKMFSNDILGSLKEEDLNKFISSFFVNKGVSNSQLIAFKIDNMIAGLYINVYYKDNTAQTYIFNFHLGGDGKIAGINTP